MGKLSQRELLSEGIGSALAGVGRVAGQALRGAANVISPTATAALGKGASLAAGAIQNIRSGSPVADVKAFLKGEEGKRLFKNGNVKFGKEQKLTNNDVKIPITSGIYLADQGGGDIEEKDLKGGFLIVRPTQLPGGQGFKNEIRDVYDADGKLNDLPLGSKQKDKKPTVSVQKATEEPKQVEDPQQDIVTTSNFKDKLTAFKKEKLNDPSIRHTELAVNEFVRSLAKDANNTKWVKNLPKYMNRLKPHDGDWTKEELAKLVDMLKSDGILQESQKNLLNHLTSSSRMNKWVIGR